MHYYQFNIADYRKDTTHLTAVQHYMYRTLIDWYYLNEKPIPNSPENILRKLSLGTSQTRIDELNALLAEFFTLKKKHWHHARIDADIKRYQKRVLVNKVNGMKGGRPRKTEPEATAKPKKAEAKATSKPVTINQTNEEKRKKLAAAAAVLRGENQ